MNSILVVHIPEAIFVVGSQFPLVDRVVRWIREDDSIAALTDLIERQAYALFFLHGCLRIHLWRWETEGC